MLNFVVIIESWRGLPPPVPCTVAHKYGRHPPIQTVFFEVLNTELT